MNAFHGQLAQATSVTLANRVLAVRDVHVYKRGAK